MPDGKTVLAPGDQVLAIVEPTYEEELARLLLPGERAATG